MRITYAAPVFIIPVTQGRADSLTSRGTGGNVLLVKMMNNNILPSDICHIMRFQASADLDPLRTAGRGREDIQEILGPGLRQTQVLVLAPTKYLPGGTSPILKEKTLGPTPHQARRCLPGREYATLTQVRT